MPRLRKTFKHLPKCIRYKHGAYYFETGKPRKAIWLSRDFSEAMLKWAQLVDNDKPLNRMESIMDRYYAEVSPTKAPSTYKLEMNYLAPLKRVFGQMKPHEILPSEIYRYMDVAKSKRGSVTANKEKSLLSSIFNAAIKWGVANENPCRLVKRFKEVPRDRYIEDWEFEAVYTLGSPLLKAAMKIAYLTALRQGDILKLKLSDISDEGIFNQAAKTQKKLIVEMSPALQEAIKEAKATKGKVIALTLFSNRKGKPYTSSGFRAMWQKLMNKALKDGVIKERFTFHDIKAKALSDIDSKHAFELGDHSDARLTERVYRRKIKRVRPVK